MAMDFDSQLIESVEVRRTRLTTSLLFGANPTERRWRDRTRLHVYGMVVAALICAFCVAISFVIMVLTDWLADREERDRQQQERQDQVSAPSHLPPVSPDAGPAASAAAPATRLSPSALDALTGVSVFAPFQTPTPGRS
jgi:hypothetical protein